MPKTLEDRMTELERKTQGLIELMFAFITEKARKLNSPSSSGGECHGGGHCSSVNSDSCHKGHC